MVHMVSTETGSVEDVPAEEVQARYQTRKWGLVRGSRIPVKTATGKIGTVPVDDIDDAFAKNAKIIEQAQYEKHQAELKYGGLGGGVAAAGEGFVRGMSVGTSDPLAIGAARILGGEQAAEATREHLKGVKETHPWVSGVAEVGGAIAPTLATGGAAGAAEGAGIAREALAGAGVLSRGVGAVGQAAERLAVGAVGEGGASLAARAARSAVRVGAGGAGEGAIFNMGNEISEDALGKHKLTAEKLVAAAGHGALMGGLFGAGLGAGGEVVKTGVRRMAEFISPRARRLAGEQAYRAVVQGQGRKYAIEAFEHAGGPAEAGNTWLKHGVIGGEGGWGLTPEEIAPRMAQARQKVGREIGAISEGSHGVVQIEEVLKPLNEAIVKEVKLARPQPIIDALTKYRDEIVRVLTGAGPDALLTGEPKSIKLMDFIDQRRALGEHAFPRFGETQVKPLTEHYQKIYGAWSDLEGKAIDRAADVLGGPRAAELKALKREYKHLDLGDQAVRHSQAIGISNRMMSPTAKAVGIATALGSAMHGNPLGVAHGLAAAYGTKIIQQRGAGVAAALLDKLATLGAMSRTAARVDAEIDGKLGSFLGGKKLPRAKPFKHEVEGTQSERYEQHVSRIQAMQQIDASHAQRAFEPINRHAPNLGAAISQTAHMATSFLATKIPPSHKDPLSVTPQLDKPRVTDAEKAKFLKYAEAVDRGPLHLVDQLAQGKLSRETVEVMKEVYPETYEEVRGKLWERLASAKEKPAYAQRVQLGILFQLATDATLKPDFVRMRQQTFAAKAPQAQPPGQVPAPANVNPARTAASMALPLGAVA